MAGGDGDATPPTVPPVEHRFGDEPRPKVPPVEHRFAKGKSGNPSGRPKDDPKFRAWCRKLSREMARKIIRKIRADPDPHVPDMVAAFEAFADRGGYLREDRRAAIEIARARVVLELTKLGPLSSDEKQDLLEGLEKNLAGDGGDSAA